MRQLELPPAWKARSSTTLSEQLERIEAAFGVMMSGVVTGLLMIASVCIVGAIALEGWKAFPSRETFIAITACIITSTLAGLMFWKLKQAFEKNSSHATLRMSLEFARESLAMRAILGLAALSTALAVLALGQMWSFLLQTLNPKSLEARVIVGVLQFIPMLGAAYATNGYLMCFMRAWNFPHALVKLAYRFRYFIDLTAAIVLIAYIDPLRV